MSEDVFAKGRCLCDAVQFDLLSEPVATGQCHCKDCQRASGTGHMSLAFFKEDDVVVRGDTKSFAVKAESGNTNTRHFCSNCGGRLFGQNSGRPGVTAVAVGSIDDNSWFVAGRVVYVKDRPIWDVTSTDVPNFDKMPPPAK
ncbi:MAG: GFA family protein [Hyphomicrobiaceae bacterium]